MLKLGVLYLILCMNYFRYTPTDEQIRSHYGDLLHKFQSSEIVDTNYHEDIALLMAHINKLLIQEEDSELDAVNVEKWKLVLETIKLKATLIKEQRLERDRIEKTEERRVKLTAIPIEDFKSAITSIVGIICKFVPADKITGVIGEMNEVIHKAQNAANKNS